MNNIQDGEQLLDHLMPIDIGHTKEIHVNKEVNELDPKVVKNFFDSDFIKEKFPTYEKRTSQIDYAIEVTKTLNDPMHNYVEAPTGIGKSLGYLIPAGFFLEKLGRMRKLVKNIVFGQFYFSTINND